MAKTSAKIGNYRAPVDPEGIDPEMQETMGIRRQRRTTVPAAGAPSGVNKKQWAETEAKIQDRKAQNAALRGARILRKRTGK